MNFRIFWVGFGCSDFLAAEGLDGLAGVLRADVTAHAEMLAIAGGDVGRVAAFGVVCTVYYAAELAPGYCSGAHQAWFYGDVDCCPSEVFASESLP